jgi:hypothetical protein
MYIEFTLPTGAGGMAAGYVHQKLLKLLSDWTQKHGIAYRTKLHKYSMRLTFDNDKHYKFFILTWQPKYENFENYLSNFKIIDPMKIDRFK